MSPGAAGQSLLSLGTVSDPEGGAVSIIRGGMSTVAVHISGPAPVSGANLILQLPPGISYVSVTGGGAMLSGGSFSVLGQALPDNRVGLLVYSDSDTFNSVAGVIAEMTISASSLAPMGTFALEIVETRDLDINVFEVTAPRGIGNLAGESIQNAAVSTSISVTSSAGALFPDSALDSILRAELIGLGANPGPTIEASELVGVGLTSLNADLSGITNLSGLEYATDLTSLSLEQNFIRDVDLLANLTSLTDLRLSMNQIDDVDALGALTSLTTLHLDFNEIRDLTPLQNLTLLTTLSLTGNVIGDISPLASLPNLVDLRLDGNRVGDISALAGLTSLNTLMLDSNLVADVSPLVTNAGITGSGDLVTLHFNLLDSGDCTNLNTLAITRSVSVAHDVASCNPTIFSDPNLEAAVRLAVGIPSALLTPGDLTGLTSLSAPNAGISDLRGLEHATDLELLVLSNNDIFDLSPLTGLIQLEIVALDQNRIIDITPLTSMTNMIVLWLGENRISDIVALGQMTGLTHLELQDNFIADITPIENLINLDGLFLDRNLISDIEPLMYLADPVDIRLQSNIFGDIGPLLAITPAGGWDPASQIDIRLNPLLNGMAICSDISTLGGAANLTLLHDGTSCISLADANEPNDTSGTATTIGPGSILSRLSLIDDGGPDDVDWYKFTLDQAAEVVVATVQSVNERSTLIFTLELYASGDLVTPLLSGDDSLATVLSPDTYYFKVVEKNGDYVGNYAARVAIDPFETGTVDDTFGNASALTFGSPHVNHTLTPGDPDWFTFTIGSVGYLQLKTTTNFGNSRLELFGPNSSTDPVSPQYVSDDNIAFYSGLPVGQYFARVTEFPTAKRWNYPFDTTSYFLTVDQQAVADAYEDDDAAVRATLVPRGPEPGGGGAIRMTHNFHDMGDEDWCLLIAPRPEFHPVIQLTDLGPRSFPVIEVYAEDMTTLLTRGTGTITIDFNSKVNEKFYIRIRNADPNVFGNDTAYGVDQTPDDSGGSFPGTIAGYVLDTDDQPVKDAVVSVVQNDPSLPPLVSLKSLANGYYEIPGVSLGEHQIEVTTACSAMDGPFDIEVLQTGLDGESGDNSLGGSTRIDVKILKLCLDPANVYVNFAAGTNGIGSGVSPFDNLPDGLAVVASGGNIHLSGSGTSQTFAGGSKITQPLTLLNNNAGGTPIVVIGGP